MAKGWYVRSLLRPDLLEVNDGVLQAVHTAYLQVKTLAWGPQTLSIKDAEQMLEDLQLGIAKAKEKQNWMVVREPVHHD